MSTKPEPLPEIVGEVGSNHMGKDWTPRSLGRLMTVIALSGLAMGALAQRSRPVIPSRTFAPGTLPIRRWVPAQVLPPSDPAVLTAPRGIDVGIDDAMIVNPGMPSDSPVLRIPQHRLPLPPQDPGAMPR